MHSAGLAVLILVWSKIKLESILRQEDDSERCAGGHPTKCSTLLVGSKLQDLSM